MRLLTPLGIVTLITLSFAMIFFAALMLQGVIRWGNIEVWILIFVAGQAVIIYGFSALQSRIDERKRQREELEPRRPTVDELVDKLKSLPVTPTKKARRRKRKRRRGKRESSGS